MTNHNKTEISFQECVKFDFMRIVLYHIKRLSCFSVFRLSYMPPNDKNHNQNEKKEKLFLKKNSFSHHLQI